MTIITRSTLVNRSLCCWVMPSLYPKATPFMHPLDHTVVAMIKLMSSKPSYPLVFLVPLLWLMLSWALKWDKKDIYTLCQIPCIKPHVSCSEFLISDLSIFLLPGPWPFSQAICHHSWFLALTCTFLFPYKVKDQVHSLKLCPLGEFSLIVVIQGLLLTRSTLKQQSNFDFHPHTELTHQ